MLTGDLGLRRRGPARIDSAHASTFASLVGTVRSAVAEHGYCRAARAPCQVVGVPEARGLVTGRVDGGEAARGAHRVSPARMAYAAQVAGVVAHPGHDHPHV